MTQFRLRIHPASFVLLGLALVAPACGGALGNIGDPNDETSSGEEDPTTSTGDGDGDATTSTGDGDGDSGGDDMTIYEVQQGAADGSVGDGTLVTLNGVVVTTPVEAEDGLVFIQEPDAGEWSGISLYLWEEVVASFSDLAPGTVVNVVGEYTEFFDMSQVIVKNPGDLVVVSEGADIPGPDIVTAADVARSNADAEPWEGVRVCVEDATIAESNDGFGQYLLEGDALVSYAFVGGSLPPAGPGGTFEQVCGSLHYSFDEFKIQPASLDDLVGYQGPAAMGATVAEVQQGNFAVDSVIELTDVVVTSGLTWTDGNDASFYVQDAGGGEYSGIQVYVADTAGVAVAIGDVVTINGVYDEFFDMSQIKVAGAGDLDVTGSGPATADMIADPATIATGGGSAEAWEGCLVTIGPVTVSNANPDDPDDFGDFAVDGGLRVTNEFFEINAWVDPAQDDAYTSLTGVMVYSFSNSKLAPRNAQDIVE